MTWSFDPDAQKIARDFLGPLTPKEVLYEFEGPCIFTAEAPSGETLLAYLVEDLEEEKALRYIVSTTTSSAIEDLKSGLLPVRDALTQGWLWLVDFSYGYSPMRIYTITPDQLPENALPLSGTMLLASLEPALRVRLVGDEIHEGQIPAQVFSQAAEIAAKSLKSVVEFALNSKLPQTGKRPPKWVRNLYSLQTRRVAYGSLEIAFNSPQLQDTNWEDLPFDTKADAEQALQEVIDEAWSLLRKGLAWADKSENSELSATDDDERYAIFEALRKLTPNQTGPVMQVEISGSEVGKTNEPYKFDRTTSKKVRSNQTTLRQRNDVQLMVFQGRIRDLDLDHLRFILRDIPEDGISEVPFVMEDENLLETAREAHYQESGVKIAARSTDGKLWTAIDIEFNSKP
ncbi:hypothetical protein KAI87_03570 [Myxococcota bacterium]|nr:hypothetical protein [Myxococcota bacterium]